MTRLTEYTSYADAQAHASSAGLWELFDGDREQLNIAHECINRYADGSGRPAVRIAHSDGSDEILSFDEISAGAARFAHWLDANGIEKGDRIAFSRPDADGYQKLWIAGPDGLGDRCLTCDPLEFRNRHSGNPAWHPSGRYIVFVLERPHKEAGRPVPFGRVPGANRGDDLWAISIDGKTFIKITNRGESGGHVISNRSFIQ